MTTSLEFFQHPNMEPRPAVEWGTGDLQSEKFDPTIIKAPTYLLKNQPIEQFYRESNLELSNVRSNDQLVPNPLTVNFLAQNINKKFPSSHPFTSQISYKALFPNYVAPEDVNRGEIPLRHKIPFLNNAQTPAQVEKTLIINKQSGKPYRHELRFTTIPSLRQGVWYNDSEIYHNPKPDYEIQQYYPAPPKLLVPNPSLTRSDKHSIDQRTARTLQNKERELMQSTQRIDYYVDGLGTRSQLNSDDLVEKKVKFDLTGQSDNTLRPFFRKGQGLSNFSSEKVTNVSNSLADLVAQQTEINDSNQKQLLTQVEKDEIRMENGKDYANLPDTSYKNIELQASFCKKSLVRSNTIASIEEINKSSSSSLPLTSSSTLAFKVKHNTDKHKLEKDKDRIDKENHDRLVNLELKNRQHEIGLIKPSNDIRLLRLKAKALENSRGAQPNLKQNFKHHINTLYEQEAKYLSQQSELYFQPKIYNPYLLKSHIDGVKHESKITSTHSNGAGLPTQNNVSVSVEANQREPRLFADKVFNDYKNIKRDKLEQVLTKPELLATPHLQENELIQKQTTYGDSYNTKKYLQENELVGYRKSGEPFYSPIEEADVNYQNIVLKSQIDYQALNDYKAGYTTSPTDTLRAHEIVDKLNEEAKEHEKLQYPRIVGPIPPTPYEKIYCTKEISEMSDGSSKRFYERVYDSPHIRPQNLQPPRYLPLETDFKAMEKYEEKLYADLKQNEQYLNDYNANLLKDANGKLITHRDLNIERARRSLDKMTLKLNDQIASSTYQNSYTPYEYKAQEKCIQNDFYKDVSYSNDILSKACNDEIADVNKPNDLTSIQDRWSKSLANKNFNSSFPYKCPDLRENIHTGKKLIKDSPHVAAKFANFK